MHEQEYCEETYDGAIQLSRQDAFATTYEDNKFSVIVSLRFFFHYEDVSSLLKEFCRILDDNGVVILDTIVWSPRAWTTLFGEKLGGRLYTHPDKLFSEIARSQGFKVERAGEKLTGF